jgi:hypothetical protein
MYAVTQMFNFRILILASLMGANLPALAQVYRSTDAEGNVTFSDQQAPRSEAVNLPETNVGDSIEVPPPSPVVEPKPEVTAEEPPSAVEGELVGVEKRDKKRRRPRKEPRS